MKIIDALRRAVSGRAPADARSQAGWASAADLDRMIERRLLTVLDEGVPGTPVGRWTGRGRHSGKMLGSAVGHSVLALAPPARGKTASVVIPALLQSVGSSSLVVHDVKPELHEACGAALEASSHVFVLDWTRRDVVPERPCRDSAGRPLYDVEGRPAVEFDYDAAEFHPRFNLLSPRIVPASEPGRSTYVDLVARALIPERGGGDTYFADKARAALTGFFHCLIAKVGDSADYDGIPADWHGMEPSIPMFVDWLSQAAWEASRDPAVDAIGAWISGVARCVAPSIHGRVPGTSDRAFKELASLVHMTDKERSGILGTLDQALLPFKNPAMRERTSACDFTPADLRGIIDPVDGSMKPFVLFVCCNQAEAAAFSNVTALLYEVLGRFAISHVAAGAFEGSGAGAGPFPLTFVFDEFSKLPAIPSLPSVVDLGRSAGVSYVLVASDYGQIERVYGRDLVRILNSTTAAKVVLPQNDRDSVRAVIDMVGKVPCRPGMGNHDFLQEDDLVHMSSRSHLVLVQSFMHRPLSLETVPYYLDPTIATKVRARGKGPVARTTMPAWARSNRVAEHRARHHRAPPTP